MTCNLDNLSFDVASTAAQYSQLTGVLAAFAFGAIALILSGDHRRRLAFDSSESSGSEDSHVLLTLMIAFMTLILSTIQYAVLAGEQGCSLVLGRAASELFLGGVSFAFSVLLLLYAVVRLVAGSGLRAVGQHARFIVATAGPALAILLLVLAAQDVALAPWNISPDDKYAPTFTAFARRLEVITIALPSILLTLSMLGWSRKHQLASLLERRALHRSLTIGPYLYLLLSILAVGRSSLLPLTDPAARIAQWEVWVWLTVCSAVLLLQSAFLAVEPQDDHGPPGGHSQADQEAQRPTR